MREKFFGAPSRFFVNSISLVPVCLVLGVLLQLFVVEGTPQARSFMDYSQWVCETCGELNPIDSDWCSNCGYYKDYKAPKPDWVEPRPAPNWDDVDNDEW